MLPSTRRLMFLHCLKFDVYVHCVTISHKNTVNSRLQVATFFPSTSALYNYVIELEFSCFSLDNVNTSLELSRVYLFAAFFVFFFVFFS